MHLEMMHVAENTFNNKDIPWLKGNSRTTPNWDNISWKMC